ncbi:MAG: hypothetical protein AAF733_00655 [Verrucomicrobiota bacterium]
MIFRLPDRLAQEIELDRPPRSIWERLFRWSAAIVFGGALYVFVTRQFFVDEITRKEDGEFYSPLAIAWFVTVLYFFHYAAIRFVKSKRILVLWFGLWIFLTICIVAAKLNERAEERRYWSEFEEESEEPVQPEGP